ncbi:hypothetical protein [Dactylosporangium sp. CA-139066]|uniref:hypothetical protein n=1 Tax=Dactylosporangium sp. CA-139066 TaxID=3239930 RepID=UPI003D91096E
MARTADEVLEIARDVLGIAQRKLSDASDWLNTPDLLASAEQREQIDSMLRQIEAAQALISEAGRLAV